MRIRNATRATDLAIDAEAATGIVRRGLGLMGRQGWSGSDGLLLERCNSVHSCFMRMAIDVAYLDKNDRVVRVVERMKPWRVGPIALRAKRVVELPVGTLARTNTAIGDQLELIA